MFRRRARRSGDAPAPAGEGEAGASDGAEAFTYLHADTIVHGTLEASGRVRVHGTVRGDVRVDGVLEVARGGLVEGATIEAVEVRVLGTVRASVTASAKVEIWKDGTLEGDVATAALDVEEGATFVGRSQRLVDGRAADGAASAEQDAGASAPDDASAVGGVIGDDEVRLPAGG